jgi:predicted metalloprotease with PDZ domain
MRKTDVTGARGTAARMAVVLLLASTAGAATDPVAPADPPAAPAAPPAPPAYSREQLDARLEAAQRDLERAAHDVARLSTELSGSLMQQVAPFTETGVIIGVQLEPVAANVGARVREISPGGPAQEAGIRAGDVLLALNGVELKGAAPARQVSAILRDVKPDSRVPVRALREGKPLEFTVVARSSPLYALTHGAPYIDLEPSTDIGLPDLPRILVRRPLPDLELATLTPRLGSYFGADKGVLVVRAPADGALKLEDGDVILAIDGRVPASGAHATRILSSYQGGESVKLRIIRQHRTLELETVLPEHPQRHEMGRAERAGRSPGGAQT